MCCNCSVLWDLLCTYHHYLLLWAAVVRLQYCCCWVDVHETRCWRRKHVYPSKYLPWRDQTSSLGIRGFCFMPHIHKHTYPHGNLGALNTVRGLKIQRSALTGTSFRAPWFTHIFHQPGSWFVNLLAPFGLRLLFTSLTSQSWVWPLPTPSSTLSVNQTHTMDQSFLCYQMVARSRLVIRTMWILFSFFFVCPYRMFEKTNTKFLFP